MTGSSHQNFGAGTYNLLVVEDNPGDVRLLQEAIEKLEFDATFQVVSNGVEALDFLHQRNEYADAPHPDVILLDLDLPKISGIDVLCDLQANETLSRIPVVILSSSTSEDDISRAYENGANAYLSKPIEPDDFTELAQSFKKFWLTAAQLPPVQE